ncbi:NAD(P)-binding protein [Exidia glandulosa HHB12029]|uniref:NAD(P)-binding protein n=1 Tax=Exidia glandulosa HHB12029 TaxID=1314781 RepID=A0A165ND91_EXIGL|nr:NAD(P)-binding protein [Exidia glandulosa HHB12029]
MGNLFSQALPPKPHWTAKDIPDLSGKVAIVTGANVGIGKETAKELLVHGAKVYVAARSRTKAEAAIADLKGETGKDALFLELDLSDLVAVKRAAETFSAQEPKLNILIANAGVWCAPVDQLSKQNYDLQLGTNVLGHYYFTKRLLPVLQNGVTDGGARVVTVASTGADLAGPIVWESFTDSPARRNLKMTPMNLYMQSKLLNVVTTREFAQRYADTGIVFSSLNPGNIRSDLYRDLTGFKRVILGFMLYDVSYGALTQLYAATAPEANVNGSYYIPWARHGKATKKAQDPAINSRFWDWMEEQVKGL